MNFERVIPTLVQIETLYTQLKNRSHSISHKSAPSFDEHAEFVQNHPYRRWFIVKDRETAIGNVYIQYNNSIGLNVDYLLSCEQINKILKEIYASHSPLPAVPSVRFGEFFLNVATDNEILQKKLSSLGFSEVERAFVLSKSNTYAWGD